MDLEARKGRPWPGTPSTDLASASVTPTGNNGNERSPLRQALNAAIAEADGAKLSMNDLTVLATEKITRKSLDEEDHRRLIEEALSEVDFSELAPSSSSSSEGNGN